MSLPHILAWLDASNEAQLLDSNSEAVRKANVHSFHYLLMLVSAVLAVITVVGILLDYGRVYVFYYLSTFILSFVLFRIFRMKSQRVHRFSIPLIYFTLLIFYSLGIFVSLYKPYGEHHPAVTFTCLLIVLPMLYLDRSLRVGIFEFLVFAVHTVLAFMFKERAVAVLDLLDTSVFMIFGVFLSGYFRYIRLENFEKDKILIKQRDTDVLTGLANRRVLFSRLEKLLKQKDTVINVIMLDIDFFKHYNDSYGHQAGDACLESLGRVLHDFGEKHGFTFCRYGGEEFTAVSSGIDNVQMTSLVEELRSDVRHLAIPFEKGINGYVSISVGYATKSTILNLSMEEYIKFADEALYEAKNLGRDRAIEAL